MSATILNTDANINAKTVMAAENAETVTGLKTFDRDPNPPFAVSSGSAVVPNLDADKLDGKEATAFLLLDGTQSMTGKLNLGSNGQIQFPASANSSTDVNCLDDYEEGTWTPTITGDGGSSGQAYSAQTGRYVKIGKQVTAWGRVTLSTLGSVTGTACIGGLPFTVDSAGNIGGMSVGFFLNFTSTLVALFGFPEPSTTRISLRHLTGAAASVSATAQANLSNTTDIAFSVTFLASA